MECGSITRCEQADAAANLRITMIANPTPHVVQQLVDELESFGEYPAKVRRIAASERILRTALFPAGCGLWDLDGIRPALSPRPVVAWCDGRARRECLHSCVISNAPGTEALRHFSYTLRPWTVAAPTFRLT